jgi:hypothetical protein
VSDAVGTCIPCPKGTWCKDGVLEACPVTTYNDVAFASDAAACKPCPPHTSSSESSVSVLDCLCQRDYYFDNVTQACDRCPTGTLCTQTGTTMETLPLLPGYWRWREDVKDVRRCPGASGSGENTGCLGNLLGEVDYCKEGLDGPYCLLCAEAASSNASSDGNTTGIRWSGGGRYVDYLRHECVPCGELSGAQILGLLLVPFGLLFYLLSQSVDVDGANETVEWVLTRTGGKTQAVIEAYVKQVERAKSRLSSRFKRAGNSGGGFMLLRELVSYTQVLTNLQDVYSISFPFSFLALVRSLASIFTFTVTLPPLACMGVAGHLRELILYSSLPPLICGTLVLVNITQGFVVAWKGKRRRRREAQQRRSAAGAITEPSRSAHHHHKAAESTRSWTMRLASERTAEMAPWCLFVLYLAYPSVASHAFRSFGEDCMDTSIGRSTPPPS